MKTKKIRKNMSLFCIITLISFLFSCDGCKDNDGGGGEAVTPTYELADNVAIVQEDTELVLEDSTDDTLTYSYTGAAPDIQPGDILLSSEGRGYLRKVISVNYTKGGALEVITEIASLIEAFRELHINKTYEIETDEFVINDIELPINEYSDFTITEGSLSFAPTFTIVIDISDFTLTQFKAELDGDINLNMDTLLTTNKGIDLSLDEIPLIPQPLMYVIPVGTTGVVVTIELNIAVGADIWTGLESVFNFGFNAKMRPKAGVLFQDGDWNIIKDFSDNDCEPYWGFSNQLSLSVKPYIRPHVGVYIYSVLGPYFDLRPYGRTELSLPPLHIDTGYGITGNTGVELKIISHVLAGKNYEIFDKYIQLPDWSGCDQDGDLFFDFEECDDNDSSVYPGAPELCDGKDNNCDGSVDEGCGGGNTPPVLSSGSVSPSSGVSSTNFTYSVHYYDADGDFPTISNVYIDGTSYTTSLDSGTSSNGVYTYTTQLDDGSHDYYFVFSDGEDEVRLPTSGTYSGPSVGSEETPPVLTSGSVSPSSGVSSTNFTYSVHYYDADGDSPTISNVYIDGTSNTMSLNSGTSSDGVYTYTTQLADGSHDYYFVFSDGEVVVRLPAVSGTYSGPFVGEVSNEMVYVPGGTFQMGYDGVATPVHEVTLSNFYMGKYEVTNAQVVEVFNWANAQGKFSIVNSSTVFNNGYQQELLDLDEEYCNIEYISGSFLVETGRGNDGFGDSVDLSNYPCIEISWYGAAAFCNYLSEIEGLFPCYDLSDWSCNFDNNGYRLPTEAEWEYAARYIDGGSFRAGDSYSGGDIAANVAWYSGNSSNTPHSDLYNGQGTHEVGTKYLNELGIYDMSGNVWEWSYDWYDSYGSGSETNPTGSSSGTYRVLRGGSWIHDADYRVSDRIRYTPSNTLFYLGFRFARTY